MTEFSRDRNNAFIGYVLYDNWEGCLKFFRKYGIKELPKEKTHIMQAGVLKAVQECTGIDPYIKLHAAKKCIDKGFIPFIREVENNGLDC